MTVKEKARCWEILMVLVRVAPSVLAPTKITKTLSAIMEAVGSLTLEEQL